MFKFVSYRSQKTISSKSSFFLKIFWILFWIQKFSSVVQLKFSVNNSRKHKKPLKKPLPVSNFSVCQFLSRTNNSKYKKNKFLRKFDTVYSIQKHTVQSRFKCLAEFLSIPWRCLKITKMLNHFLLSFLCSNACTS